MPIGKFFPGKRSTVSCGDSCFHVLEVRHGFFQVYYMWCDTRIHDKCFAFMLLAWCFINKYFIVDYVFCDVVCILFSRLFLLVAILFFLIVQISIIAFILVIFVLVVLWFFFPDSLPTVFIYMSSFVAVMKFCYVCNLFMPELFSFVTVFPTSRAGTLILEFYVEGFFIFSWKS